MKKFAKIRIVGAGLIGTSLGLALKQRGYCVEISDSNASAALLATSLIASEVADLAADLIVVAVPSESIFEVLVTEYKMNSESMFIDLGGIKSELIQEVEKLPELAKRFCSTHPMAGREFAGAESAQADLFEGRAWILVPTTQTMQPVMAAVSSLIQELGATNYTLSAKDHDAAMAGISHLPQIVSSVLGACLNLVTDQALLLAGAGLRDVTRLASSSPELWIPLLLENRQQVMPILNQYLDNLSTIAEALNRQDAKAIKEVFALGNAGRARIPGKHGAKVRDYTFLPVVIEDRAGQLAALFEECAAANVNVEDLSIEHSPGQETGLITLALSLKDALTLQHHLLTRGWAAHAPRS